MIVKLVVKHLSYSVTAFYMIVIGWLVLCAGDSFKWMMILCNCPLNTLHTHFYLEALNNSNIHFATGSVFVKKKNSRKVVG